MKDRNGALPDGWDKQSRITGLDYGHHLDHRFYILPWSRFRDLLVNGHAEYLDRHGGVRPKKWDSLHTAIKKETLLRYQNKWDTIERNLR